MRIGADKVAWRQIGVIEDMTGAMDPAANFSLVILQTELERVKFLMRGLLRSRIAKVRLPPIAHLPLLSHSTNTSALIQIDAYPQHYTALSSTSLTLLSPLESRYLTSHSALLSTHYYSSFLSQFPSQLQKLDDTGGGISMVDAPDEDRAVFVRVLRDGVVERPPEEEVQLRRGDVWVLRWRWVKSGVRRGDLEVI